MRYLRVSRLLLSLCVGLLLLTGCGPGKGTPVSGKLILPPGVKTESNDSIEVVFSPEDAKMRGATAKVNSSDLTFTVDSAETKGVLPGKYKVTVKITPYMGQQGSDKRAMALEPMNKNFDLKNSKLTYEVTAGTEHKITIDLTKGTITKD
jgi:hypothetical protein